MNNRKYEPALIFQEAEPKSSRNPKKKTFAREFDSSMN